jgi:hypothetical protein
MKQSTVIDWRPPDRRLPGDGVSPIGALTRKQGTTGGSVHAQSIAHLAQRSILLAGPARASTP